MRERIAKALREFKVGYIPMGANELYSQQADQILKEVCEEIEPHLEKIDKLTSEIEGDWTDPRHECDKISEEIQAILALVRSV